jgi:hypothetical protein
MLYRVSINRVTVAALVISCCSRLVLPNRRQAEQETGSADSPHVVPLFACDLYRMAG